MKNLLFFVFAAVLAVACNQAPKFTINGNIEGLADGTVYLKQRVGGEVVNIDSAKSVGGKFVLQGVVEVPDLYMLSLGERKNISVFVENKAIQVTGKADDLRNAAVTGSASHDEMKVLESKSTELNGQMKEFYEKYSEAKKANNEADMALFEKKVDSLDNVQNAIYKDFVTANPNSFVAPVILQRIQYGMEADEIEGFVQKFSPEVMKSQGAKAMAERVTILKKVAVGQTAPDFT
jgi:hypothetical protein